LFHQKPHKNPNFMWKSNHKQKENILLHEKLLKRATFTRFSIKNRIKTQALHGNHSTNKKKNILMHEKSLKRAIFTRFSNINEIKNQPFAETKSAKTKSATTKSTETLRAQRRRQIERSRQWTKREQEMALVNERARVKVKS